VCERIMAFLVRQCVTAFTLGALLFCISCEKHPVGQMPEVQREQADPVKRWSDEDKAKSENPASSKEKAGSDAAEPR
jgi:hypothetical protein